MSVTVEEALVKLYEVDAFSRVDEAFATSLISRMKGPGLTKRQLKAATAMLRRYSKPMERLNLGDLRESEVAPAAEVVEAASRALSQGVRVSIEVINRERRICVRSPFKYKDLMKGLSGARWAGSVKAWTYPATLTCAANIEDALSRAPDPVSFDQEFQTLVDQRTVVAEAQTLKSAEDLPDVPNSKTSAWLHQRQAYHFASQLPSAMLAMSMGQQPYGAQVLTPNGWRDFGSLAVGDEVIGSDGLPVLVRECKPWEDLPVWEVETEDGAVVECSPNHLWTVEGQNSSSPQTLPLFAIRETLGGLRHNRLDRLPQLAPIERPEVPLPLDPYVMGIMLGDGSFARCCAPSGRTAMRLAGEKNRARVEHLLPDGIAMTTEKDGKHHHFQGPTRELVHRLGFCGVRSSTKFIPAEYLNSSVRQRKALLAGLMDTDGTRGNRQSYYSTISPRLAEDVESLVRSLGGRGGISFYPKKGEYRVRTRLDGPREMRRRIVDVRETSRVEPQRCIRVANEDGLYVTDGYVLTHNTGKSKCTVDILTNNNASRVLILCPVSVLRVWPREFRTHAVDDWNVVVLDKKSGKVAERVEKAEAALKLPGRTAIVINYEACDQKVFAEWALTIDWDYLVCDESHRLKMPNGSRSKYVGKLATRAARKLNLTGTPMPQTPLDVWAQFRTLDPHIFGSSYHRFKGVYALWGGYENREFMGMNPLMADDFEEKMAGITYRVTADVLDLPPDRDVERVCTLSSKAQKLYKGIKDELHGEVFNEATGDRQTVSMDNVLTKLLRMQQITGGAVNDDDGKSTEVDDSKRKLLEDVLEDIDPKSPVVVFCRFVHDLDQVKKVATKLGRNYGELSGRQNDLNDDAKMPDWCDVMAVQIQAGGVGIDLTRAHFGIYYSVGYDLGAYLQSRARLVRPGQGEEVLFIHLVAAGTIDEEVYKALSSKQKIVDYVLETI
jgi:hypothetical protein